MALAAAAAAAAAAVVVVVVIGSIAAQAAVKKVATVIWLSYDGKYKSYTPCQPEGEHKSTVADPHRKGILIKLSSVLENHSRPSISAQRQV